MSSIKTAISLYDGVTGPLRSMTKVMDTVIGTFERMGTVSGSAIRVDDMIEARAELTKMTGQLELVDNAIGQANIQQQRFNQSLQTGSIGADSLLSKIKGIVSTYASIQGVRIALNWTNGNMALADTQRNMENQLASVLKNMGQTEQAYDSLLAKASEIQSKGIYGDEAMIGAAGELSTYFSDTDAIALMMDTLSNYAMGMTGGGAIDATSMVEYATNLGKIMSGSYDAMTKKGFAFTDAQKAIIEGTATEKDIVEALGEEYLDVSGDMQAAMAITQVIDEAWADLYTTMSNTPEGKIISLQNSLGDLREELGNQTYPAVLNLVDMVQQNFPQIEQLAYGLAQGASTLLGILSALAQGTISVASAFMDNWSWIGPIILGVVAALAAYQLMTNTARIATAAWTAVQGAFNAVMAANPVTLIVMGVILLIAAIYAIVGAINQVTDQSISATGVIVGTLFTAGAFILNAIIGVINSIIQAIWTIFVEPFLRVIEFVINAACGGFDSFGDAVASLIGNIISWFLDLGKVVTTIIDAIFGTNWTAGLNSLQAKVLSWGKNESAITIDWDVPSLDRIEYGDAWDYGYNLGQGLEDKVSNLFSPSNDYSNLLDNNIFGNGFDYDSSIAANTADTAVNTAKAANTLDIASEDLAYMKDIAEREAINRYTTAQIVINQENNQINSDADIDGIAAKLAGRIIEEVNISAEGVHIS